MLPVQRRSQTLDLLNRQQVVSVEELADRLSVSLSTIRRDLDELERQGTVRRVHGGAILQRPLNAPPDLAELPPATREIERHQEKLAIAQTAISLIRPASAVLLSGGTTTAALAPLLADVPGITIVTNSLDVAIRLADVDVELVLLGGALRRPELSLLGTLVSVGLDEMHIDHVVMGVYGIDPRGGLLGASALECETDRRIARSGARLTVLADASKFARRSPHRIADLDAVAELVTNTTAPPQDLAAIRRRGLTVHLA